MGFEIDWKSAAGSLLGGIGTQWTQPDNPGVADTSEKEEEKGIVILVN